MIKNEKYKKIEKLFVFDEKKSVELFGITYFDENPIWFIRKKCPQKSSKIWIFWIFGFSAGTFRAVAGRFVICSRARLVRARSESRDVNRLRNVKISCRRRRKILRFMERFCVRNTFKMHSETCCLYKNATKKQKNPPAAGTNYYYARTSTVETINRIYMTTQWSLLSPELSVLRDVYVPLETITAWII